MLEFTIRIPLERRKLPDPRTGEAAPSFGTGHIESSDRGTCPSVRHLDGLSILSHGRLRLDGRAVDSSDGFARLAEAWRSNGAALFDRLDGEFVLAIGDARSGAWAAAVDRFSSFRVYYAEARGEVAFGTSPLAVARSLGAGADVNPHAILAYVFFHVIPAPLSIVRGVHRIEHGHALAADGQGRWSCERYWSPRFEERRPFDFSEQRGRFLEALRSGVRECTEGLNADQVGCFLSGGTDSSTIAGLTTELFGVGARTFSIGFGIDGYDETHYARVAVEHFKTRHKEYYLTPGDVEDALPMIAASYEQPFGNASAVPTYFCALMARKAGVARMLGGDGGDELYGGNERYAKQWMLSLWDEVPSPIRRGIVEPLLFGPLKNASSTTLRKARSYIESSRIPFPERLQGKYNLLDHFGRGRVFTDAFVARARGFEPKDLAREVWERSDAGSQINRLLAYDFKFTLADNDLPKVTRTCEIAGVEVAYPMLSRAVTDFSLSLPPDQKLRGTTLRYFFKRALRGFLPDEILRKKKHGFGMPFGAWVLERPELARIADDALGGLRDRGYLQPAFIDELRRAVASPDAGYYGTMVWILSVLELWLQEHIPDARCG